MRHCHYQHIERNYLIFRALSILVNFARAPLTVPASCALVLLLDWKKPREFLRSSHGPATGHAGRLGDVLVYSHARIGMTGSCIIAVNFIIPWILLFIYTQTTGTTSSFQTNRELTRATGATNPADRPRHAVAEFFIF